MSDSTPIPDPNTEAMSALTRLGNWKAILATWQLGTKAKGSPTSDAVRHHREATLKNSAMLEALLGVLISKGVITTDEFYTTIPMAVEAACSGLEHQFPGVKVTDKGIEVDRSIANVWLSKFPQ
jgi:hypothetical protein